jgi:hypothetical protein
MGGRVKSSSAALERNDEILERRDIGRGFKNDTERLEKLVEMDTKMTAKAGLCRAPHEWRWSSAWSARGEADGDVGAPGRRFWRKSGQNGIHKALLRCKIMCKRQSNPPCPNFSSTILR